PPLPAPSLAGRLAGRLLCGSAAPPSPPTSGTVHPSQAALLSEQCILVDTSDRVLGAASKEFCHRADNVRAGRALHRAFSLFLLDSGGRLLLQRRSLLKLTFPGRWTNTCCSHPLHTADELQPGLGVKLAAARRTRLELGLRLPPGQMEHLATIVYQADCDSTGQWAEHEVDHVLRLRLPAGANEDVQRKLWPDPNEVAATAWLADAELDDFVAERRAAGEPPTPWFELVLSSHRHLLFDG
ncbi:hypothetical protein BOX15_Mlig009961g2, partial [Macrostomum lignano]